MGETATREALAELMVGLSGAMAECLQERAGDGELHVRPVRFQRAAGAALLENGDAALLGGVLGDEAEEPLRVAFDAAAAAILASGAGGADDGAIDSARLAAIGELAAPLGEKLRESLRAARGDDVELRLDDAPASGDGARELLGDADIVALWFELQVDDRAPAQIAVLVTPPTAERWNGAPVADAGEVGVATRGQLVAYLLESDTYQIFKRGCRRAGLELVRRARTDIPHPAAHRGEMLAIEVPAGDTRRFDWCRRLKGFDAGIRVLLMIRQPSRSRVYQGFVAGADAIVAWPIDEQQLAAKLDRMLDEPDE